MQLIDLECVIAAAEHGGFTAGAAAVGISQPALSKRIAALETELGTQLFHRTGRTIRLTAAGEACCLPARHVLHDVDAVRRAVAAVRGLEAGRVELAALPTLVVGDIVPLIGRFRQRHPAVVVRTTGVEDVETVAALVASARCDVGLSVLEPVEEKLVIEPLFEQELVTVSPPGQRNRRHRIKASDLAERPVVTVPRGTSTRGMLDALFAEIGVVPRIAVETNQRDALVPLVLAGAGFTLLPQPLAEDAARLGAVIAPVDPPLRRTITLLTRPGPQTAAGQAFVDLVKADATTRPGALVRSRGGRLTPNEAPR